MTNKKNLKQANLFKSMQLYRLENDLRLVNARLEKNRAVEVSTDDGFFKRFWTGAVNEYKDYRTGNLSKVKDSIVAEHRRFLTAVNDTGTTLYKEKEISRIIDDVFSDDKYGIERTMFSISLAFDTEYHYEYEDDGLEYISRILWADELKLSTIKNGVEDIYVDLARQPLSRTQRLVLGSVAALSLFVMTVPALTIGGGLAAPGITSGLATFGTAFGIGGSMVEGVELILLAEMVLNGAIIGFTYKMLDAQRKSDVKQQFRSVGFSNAAQMLAVKCYIMQVAKYNMPRAMFKEKTSELLEMISDLKSDTDYVLFVEGENREENKKKINVFHNFDDKLCKILGV